MERKMFYGAKSDIFEKAKFLREHMTLAEKRLWERLKENKLYFRFKPQHPVNIYIADFYCHQLKLVIEIDGKIHDFQREMDQGRSDELEMLGITILRFTNEEVFEDLEKVVSEIKNCTLKLKMEKTNVY
jgi:very-short-patch-repair endonuclease